ncbi:Tet(A)/Tet(B)/Tet(C) family tetracycline efflux MFS transporter [Trinickia fusca]|uniref:Tet(A)/Tet(B)/Tet(C) family tetracycline efflux MFS transporter n=1 Tax=Trinickia fusca TaxID=2419777 RepID=A0A494X508_9BURK|nr:Tet(A)/Tet(B)/Tet(C) family tetracycline efflux MFS transporter [Trinickia fusca]RKP43286.1 Tet(A)/Tet(B)/Tet(C) family tetracycline efflux MFS transporter [Trinickia fusca]
MSRSVVVIMMAVLLDAVGIGLILPILPALLRSLAGANSNISTHFGALLAIYALMQFLFAPILGALSDRFGRRPVLLLSLVGAALDYLLMAAAPSLIWLYIGRVLSGVTGANLSVATAYLTDVTPEGDRARRFGQMGAMMGIGFIAGPLIGGALGGVYLRAPFLAAAAMNALNLLLAWWALPESRTAAMRSQAAARRLNLNAFASLHRLDGTPQLMPLVGVYAVIVLAGQVPGVLWILYGQDHFGWSPMIAGMSLASYGACHALSQAFAIGPIVKRLGERRALVLGLAADVLGLVLMAVATHAWMPFVLLPLFAVGSMTIPALQAMMARQVDDARQGELQGTLTSTASLISAGGPLAVTAIYSATRATLPGGVWLLGAACYLAVLPLLFNARMRTLGRAEEQQAETRV